MWDNFCSGGLWVWASRFYKVLGIELVEAEVLFCFPQLSTWPPHHLLQELTAIHKSSPQETRKIQSALFKCDPSTVQWHWLTSEHWISLSSFLPWAVHVERTGACSETSPAIIVRPNWNLLKQKLCTFVCFVICALALHPWAQWLWFKSLQRGCSAFSLLAFP